MEVQLISVYNVHPLAIQLIYAALYLLLHLLFKQSSHPFQTSTLPFFWLLLTFSHFQL